MIPACLELLSVLALGSTLGGTAAPQTGAALLDHASLQQGIERLVLQHGDQVRQLTIATSRAGREVSALRITNGADPVPGTPAILIVAGIDGPRAYTSSLALRHAWQLVAGYGRDEKVTGLLDTTTVYVVPRLDVDGCEARFATPLAEVLGTGHGFDDDRDGRQGEDGPADVNGDGVVSWMRVPDPEGTWVADPNDPRALREAERAKGERGTWKLLPEGLDSDGDEEVAEDPERDAVVNRNFPRHWKEHDPASGLYPTHEPVAEGMVNFLLEAKDIALVVTYGEQGNLVEKPEKQGDDGPSRRGDVRTGVYESDLPLYEELGERYREATENETKGLGEQHGSLQGFLYHHRGLLCLDVDPWSMPLDAEPPEEAPEETDGESGGAEEKDGEETDEEELPDPSDDARRLDWADQNAADAYIPWTPFDHPQLGPVEIGGWRPYARVEPPASELDGLAESHFAFLLQLGALLPRLEWTEATGAALGGGLVEVRATLENAALLPQQTRAAIRSRTVRPARVRLVLPEGAELLGGEPQTLVRDLAGTGGRRELRWLVGGVDDPTRIQVSFDTDNAGAAIRNLEETN